jgi:Protein of unknown function (DUF3604)
VSKFTMALLLLLFALPLCAQENSPSGHVAGPTHLYWGDLHVHSNYSPDSFAFGNSRLTPDNAFKFARGEQVSASNGMKVQLQRPLDFLLVADHAEFIGVFPMLLNHDPQFLDTQLGKQWGDLLDKQGDVGAIIGEWLSRIQNPDYQQELSAEFRRSVWQQAAGFAERHNAPGLFTAFVGYEWTAMVAGNNLHRVILFRDGADKATRVPPFSALDSLDPELLWQALARYEAATGGQVMAIPHNGNVSNGLMFPLQDSSGRPIDKSYAINRSRWEPIYEVTQVKGDGEAHPFLSPDDEFADFETWDDDNISRQSDKQPSMLKHEYARSALQLGLELERSVGVNPYQFGLIGSTDSHTTLATADDNNFWGKFPDSEPGPQRLSNRMGGALWKNWKLAASGYAGVWARENTREALFDALARKEVYATTGPRIALRTFAGWDFEKGDILSPNLADIGYAKGVPMGGRLYRAPPGGQLGFLVQAFKDTDGANLDRVQIVKSWLDGAAVAQEKIYDIALSDGRKVDGETGKAPALASTVNVKQATYSNSIGAVSFEVFWQDPDFQPDQAALYYVRVMEIATPRWTAYDARDFDIEVSKDIPMITQERIYSSPIWYSPTTKGATASSVSTGQ